MFFWFYMIIPGSWQSTQYDRCSVHATRWRAIVFKHGSNEKNSCDGTDDKDLERERVEKVTHFTTDSKEIRKEKLIVMLKKLVSIVS